MGLFSTHEKIYVSSVAYNMAGDLADRPNFLKNLVITSALTDADSMADNLIGGYLHGPGINQRSFYRWSKLYYPEGSCQGAVTQAVNVDIADISSEIPVGPGESIEVHAAFIDMGDISYWGERWLLENQPSAYDNPWIADYDPGTRELVLTFPFAPEQRVYYPGFDNTKKYIFAYYTKTLADSSTVKRLFIYKLGTGNATLDALDTEIALAPEIFPVIPLRLFNRPINDPIFADTYAQHAKAFKKSTGAKIEDILASIEDNDHIDDVDYAFLVHGVELNTLESQGKRYLFAFLSNLIADQKTTPLEFTNWLFSAFGYETEAEALQAWKDAQLNPLDPLYGTPRPTMPARSELEITRFEVKTTSSLRYQTNLGWVTIDKSVNAGLGKPDAKPHEIWTEVLSDIGIPGVPFDLTDGSNTVAKGTVGRVKFTYQVSPDSYETLLIYGMFHENFVYDGKTVTIGAVAALNDPDVSGFVVPLHYPTLLGLPLSISTQLALSSRILVFNCYEVVKIHWYQTGIFRFVISLIISVTIAVFAGPAGLGILGSNLAVGSALGMTGTTALIVGSIANSLAAMVLVTVIQKGSVAVFGDKLGAVIGSIAGFLAVNYATSFMSGGAFNFNLSDMLKAENLLKLTNAVTGSVEAWARSEAQDLGKESVHAYDQYKSEYDKIEKAKLDLLGYGEALLNPLMFTDTGGSLSFGSDVNQTKMMQPESSTAFLTRTLMTGSDIVQMSLSLIRDYPEISLQLPKPFI